jgi:hypothetical protein
MPEVRFSFSSPSNGWLPIRIQLGDTVTEFVASDVPNNPIEELCNAVASTASGRDSKVWWNLEPDGYFFELSNTEEQIQLRLFFAKNSEEGSKSEIASATGSKPEILLPLWRALRQFESLQAQEPHWPSTHLAGLNELRDVLQKAG